MIKDYYLEGRVFHVCLQGTLNETNADDLATIAREGIKANVSEIWIDCDQLEEISPAGLEFLTLLQHWLHEQHIQMLLIQLNHTIMQLFQHAQLDATLPVYATKEAAYKQLQWR